MPWFVYLMIMLLSLNVIACIYSIDRPRKPMSASTAVFVLLTNALFIWGLLALSL